MLMIWQLGGLDIETTLGTVLLICIILVMTFLFYMLIRNIRVFKERNKLHKAIFKKDKDGKYIRTYKEIKELLKEQNSISSYHKMMLQVWKKPSSFYKEFLEKLNGRNN